MNTLVIDNIKVKVVEDQIDDIEELQGKFDLLFTTARLMSYEVKIGYNNLYQQFSEFFITLFDRNRSYGSKNFKIVVNTDREIVSFIDFHYYVFEGKVDNDRIDKFSLSRDEIYKLPQKIDELIDYL